MVEPLATRLAGHAEVVHADVVRLLPGCTPLNTAAGEPVRLLVQQADRNPPAARAFLRALQQAAPDPSATARPCLLTLRFGGPQRRAFLKLQCGKKVWVNDIFEWSAWRAPATDAVVADHHRDSAHPGAPGVSLSSADLAEKQQELVWSGPGHAVVVVASAIANPDTGCRYHWSWLAFDHTGEELQGQARGCRSRCRKWRALHVDHSDKLVKLGFCSADIRSVGRTLGCQRPGL